MNSYKLTKFGIIRTSDNAAIPADLFNRDYKEYLQWVSGGGVVDPADFLPDSLPPAISQITNVVLRDDPVFLALLKVIASRFNIPVAQLVDEIKVQV